MQPLLKCYFKERRYNPIKDQIFMTSSKRCSQKKISLQINLSVSAAAATNSGSARCRVCAGFIAWLGSELCGESKSWPLPHSASSTLPAIVNAPARRPSLVLCVYCLPASARYHWLGRPLPGDEGSRVYFCRLASGGKSLTPSLPPSSASHRGPLLATVTDTCSAIGKFEGKKM